MTSSTTPRPRRVTRRTLLRSGAVTAGAMTALGPSFWRTALAAATPAVAGPSPYGPLLARDPNGLQLPEGFSSRLVARGKVAVAGTGFVFPTRADGQATFATPDGGWILVTNSEVHEHGRGGASAIRFGPSGEIVAASRILGDTTFNCAGGPTPWGTWMSCEEVPDGLVWECDPTGAQAARAVRSLGRFKHEALAVDPVGQRVYLSEDEYDDAGFYRFTPASYPDLRVGVLEIATVAGDGSVRWTAVPRPDGGAADPTRHQVPGSSRFDRGEGLWFDSGMVYLVTSRDNRIHAYDTTTARMEVVYDAATIADPVLTHVDGITASAYGDLFVCEDDGGVDPLDICIVTRERTVDRFLKLTGAAHVGSEMAGVCFSPDGTRMYFSTPRSFGNGAVYEVAGPFRLPERAATELPASPPAPLPRPPAPSVAPAPGMAPPPPPRPASTSLPFVAGPALGVETARRVAVGALRRPGLAVRLTLDEPGTVTVTLRAATGSLKGVPLGRARLVASSAGPARLSVRVPRSSAGALLGRARSASTRLEVTLVGASGRRATVTRTVRVLPSRAG